MVKVNIMSFETVIGIETHIELKTQSKAFCNCKANFGDKPNTNCCPICSGVKGAKPIFNKAVVDYAIKAGLALNCKINLKSSFDRKHYSYHDLPKGYQITQYFTPICQDGFIELDSGKRVKIERIHIEEDTCKSIYTDDGVEIDYNRSGIPLIEIVTAPDISSADEAGELVEKLQSIIRYTGVSDCKMSQGSMRCDINLSLKGERIGERVEIKNLNGIGFIKKAIKSEVEKQSRLLLAGGEVLKQTLKFDEKTGECKAMREKEASSDYGYSPEPDLSPIIVEQEQIEKIRQEIGEMPKEKLARLIKESNLPQVTAKSLCKYKRVADFFELTVKYGGNPITVANLIVGTLFSKLTEEQKEEFNIGFSPLDLAELSNYVQKGFLFNNAQKVLLRLMNGERLSQIVQEDFKPLTEEELMILCTKAVQLNTQAVEKFKGGNCSAINALYGYVIKNSGGRADIGKARKIIDDLIRE